MLKKIGGVLVFGAPMSVFAAPLDITGATGALTSVSDTVPVIGAAFLAVLGLMAAWKLARGLFA
ncbi:MAG: major capsid protein [Magnetococcus sp. YQC-3]